MNCPDCGYVLSPFDKECPRCAKYGKPAHSKGSGLEDVTTEKMDPVGNERLPAIVSPPPAFQANLPPPPSVTIDDHSSAPATKTVPSPLIDPALLSCPVCGNETVQKVTAVCESGTWTTQMRGASVMYGQASSGQTFVAGGPTVVSGQGMSHLAGRLMPPPRPYLPSANIFICAIGFLLCIVGFIVSAQLGVSTAIGLIMVLGGAAVWRGEILNTRRRFYPAQEAALRWEKGMVIWNRIFYCQRCDNVYDPQDRQYQPLPQMYHLLYKGLPVAPQLSHSRDHLPTDVITEYGAALGIAFAAWLAVVGIAYGSTRADAASHQAAEQHFQKIKAPLQAEFQKQSSEANATLAEATNSVNANPDNFTLSDAVATLRSSITTAQQDLDNLTIAPDETDDSVVTDTSSQVQQCQSDIQAMMSDRAAVINAMNTSSAPAINSTSGLDSSSLGANGLGTPPAPDDTGHSITIRSQSSGGGPIQYDPHTGQISQ